MEGGTTSLVVQKEIYGPIIWDMNAHVDRPDDHDSFPATTGRCADAGLRLAYRIWRWSIIGTALARRLAFVGFYICITQ